MIGSFKRKVPTKPVRLTKHWAISRIDGLDQPPQLTSQPLPGSTLAFRRLAARYLVAHPGESRRTISKHGSQTSHRELAVAHIPQSAATCGFSCDTGQHVLQEGICEGDLCVHQSEERLHLPRYVCKRRQDAVLKVVQRFTAISWFG
jgi:hypothetical protein